MDNICENIEEYNPDKEHKVLVAWIYASLQKKLMQKHILLSVIDTTLASDNHLLFRMNLSERIWKQILTIDKFECLTREETLPLHQSGMTEQAKSAYSPLGKAFEKQIKTVEDEGQKQIKAIAEHGKQLTEPNAIVKKCDYDNEKDINLLMKGMIKY